jgi:phosphoribosyl 1,2-cyclic phosphate phosphodiesterase
MKATFLGTGTSNGVPMIGCRCAVCTSSDPRNRRRRTALYVEAGGTHLVIDTPPDFREQALETAIPRVDAVLFTHTHADHIFGFDDLRRFNLLQGEVIPAYASAAAIRDLRRIFNYVNETPDPRGLFRPVIRYETAEAPFRVGAVAVEPVPVFHGDAVVLGYRLDADGRTLGYVPDCSRMPDAALERFSGVDVMILDALRRRPHLTHFTVAESTAVLRRIGAARSYIIHMCHDLDHAETERALPDGMAVSYDGLTIAV